MRIRPPDLATPADLFPTLLDLAGVQPPQNTPLDGTSLKPLLLDNTPPEREALYWNYPHYSNQRGKPGAAIRKGDWKLIQFYEGNRLELYNLDLDPPETRELADQQPKITSELLGLLKNWREAVNAQLPTPNSNFNP